MTIGSVSRYLVMRGRVSYADNYYTTSKLQILLLNIFKLFICMPMSEFRGNIMFKILIKGLSKMKAYYVIPLLLLKEFTMTF